ncbi:MAG: DHHA1 domain-containing protein [Candidatus Bathyarchaeia archaeon]
MRKWIFTHGDGDGLCAGALALAANPDAEVFFTHPFGLLEDLEQVEAKDSVVICDIALSEGHLPKILTKFAEIAETGSLLYIDHHPLPEALSEGDIPGRVIHALGSATSELAFSFFQSVLEPSLSRVAIYGAIADYSDNTPVVNRLLRSWDKRTIYFETGVLIQGIEGKRRDYDFKREMIYSLAKNVPPSFHNKLVEYAVENTRMEETVIRDLRNHIQKHGKVAYVLDVPFSFGKTAIYTRALADALVGVAGEKRKNFIDMSLRTCERDVDLNKILRYIAPKLGGSGGGHPAAAGARVPEEKFSEFIEELDKTLQTLPMSCSD